MDIIHKQQSKHTSWMEIEEKERNRKARGVVERVLALVSDTL